jgi:release factor glutamine methyltransferase
LEQQTWTILKVIQWTTDYFARKEIDQPRANAEVLLAHVLGMERVELYICYDKPLTPCELATYRQAVQRRAAREPSQYITQKQEFWSLELEVNPAVLIPRPETELLVMRTLDLVDRATPLIMDLGTGSGAIAIALAHEHSRLRVVATDSSPAALSVARSNAIRHDVQDRIFFAAMSLFEALPPSRPIFDFIISNPPYIGDIEFAALPPEIACYEPACALKGGGSDGLGLVRRILGDAPLYLKPGGWLLMEIGQGQASTLQQELSENPDFDAVHLSEDYSGILRLLSLRRNV